MFRTFGWCVFVHKQFWYGLKGGGHNVFKAANLPTNWLKIPKSVIVTDFPFEQLFKYLVYLAELCCDSKDEVLVGGRSSSRSCRLAVGVVGVVGTFSSFVSLPMGIPVQSSVLSTNDTITNLVVPVMAGDCGDEIPSKSKPQPAGVTSYANPANLLVFR